MRKTQKKHRKLLQSCGNCIIIKKIPNNVKRISIELLSVTPSDQSGLFVLNNGQAYGENAKNNISCKETKGVVKEWKMESINILDAANFLVQLYFKTGEKYKCTRTKIEKLLVIANLIAYINESSLFEHKMLVNKCGVGIPILGGFYLSNIVDGIDTDESINSDTINENTVIPSIYMLQSDISDDVKKLLTEIFLKFGAYDAWKIGNMYDDFKRYISEENPLDKEHPIITANNTITYFSNASSIHKNELTDFILSQKHIKEV